MRTKESLAKKNREAKIKDKQQQQLEQTLAQKHLWGAHAPKHKTISLICSREKKM